MELGHQCRGINMKKPIIVMLILAMAVVLYILIPGLSWTDDQLIFHGDTLHSPATRCLNHATNHSAAYPVAKGESDARLKRSAQHSSI